MSGGASEDVPRRAVRVLGLALTPDEVAAATGGPAARDGEGTPLRVRAARELGVAPEALHSLRIAKRSLDARRRGRRAELRFIVQVDVALDDRAARESPSFARAMKSGRARERPEPARFEVEAALESTAALERNRERRVAVLGSGPAGLFAAWTLAANGVGVDVVDRGPALPDRGRAVARFVNTREPDPERNLLFGEGGAGTYSDGKLYTRSHHPLEAAICDVLVEAGAPEEIAFDARAHVGTDRLHRVLPVLRERMEARGVRFHFDTRVEGLETQDAGGQRFVRALRTARGELGCDALVLAPGHSARDTQRMLADAGVAVEGRPFQLGLRIEHPQDLIDRGRFGSEAGHPALGRAYYALVAKGQGSDPAVHSFCMCPGGQIVAAVSEPGLLCTNGMSNSRHSSPWANSGIVVTVGPREFADLGLEPDDPFAGVDYQRRLEQRFFEAGGGDYRVPAQRVPGFLDGKAGRDPEASSYKLGLANARIDELLPVPVRDALRRALLRFDREIPGFAGESGVLVGIESRSASPLRLPRDRATLLAQGFGNLWPAGEGAGHAGGIMSAAIDGARCAQALLEQPLPTRLGPMG